MVDFTSVHTWAGFVYVAFVIDAFARRIVGWKVSNSATLEGMGPASCSMRSNRRSMLAGPAPTMA